MSKKLLYIGLLLPVVAYTASAGTTEEPLDEVFEPASMAESIEDIHEEVPEDLDEDMDEEGDNEEDQYEKAVDPDLLGPAYARGNFYKKQQTLKQAHEVYQDIRQKEALVAQFESSFIIKKNELTNKLEESSQALGSTVTSIYQALLAELEKFETLQKPDHSMSQDERIKLTHAQETKASLMLLQKDMEALTELYKASDQAMQVLMQQITAAHNFEQKAYENEGKIAHVLSDQVADQLYAEIVAARENINNINEYIKGDFSHYFDELSKNVEKSIAAVATQLATLKERGVDLVVVSPEKTSEKPLASAAEKSSAGFFSSIFSKIYNFFAALFMWVKGFFA